MKGVLTAAALLLTASASWAAPPARDPDWPCQAIRVPDLSLGTIWSGPPIEAHASDWSRDPTIATLVGRLVQRRLTLEQVRAEIDAFAQAAGAGRQERLVTLFAGVFQTLGEERTSVLDGLDRYGRRQKQLADQVRAEADEFRGLQSAPAPDPARVAELTQRLTWDTRVFEDRRQMLSAACDVPTVIEQRLYALAKAIEGAMR